MPLEGLCVSRAALILPTFALRRASAVTGDQSWSLMYKQGRWPRGTEAYRCSRGCVVGWLPSDQASLGRRLPSHGAGMSSRASGALPVSVGWTWSFAVPWPCALGAEHVSLGSALEVAGWRQLALSDVPIKSCSRYLNMTPGHCD